MTFNDWILRHGISRDAIAELNQLWGTVTPPASEQSEAAVSQRVRLQASKQGARLWRNNVGVMMNENNTPVRFGLANESPQMNKHIKSSDLIGITPVTITPGMVGSTVGVFTAYEVKEGGWKYRGKGREVAQLEFIKMVSALGGIARFVNSEADL